MPFELPTNFNVSIQECLDNEHLTGKARGKFITAIAHSIFEHKSYPTQEEYKRGRNDGPKMEIPADQGWLCKFVMCTV